MRSEEQENILIVGSGAMAGLFAARLAATGAPITILGTWPEGLKALDRYGIRLVEPDGIIKTYPVHAVNRPQDCPSIRHALVLVKSWQTERAACQLRACLRADGLVLTLQNGLGNRETLIQSLGLHRVALGVTTQGATLLAPGLVRPVGEPHIALAEHSRLGPLSARLAEAGFAVETLPDAETLLWGKLVINAAINPLTALLGIPNGELLHRPGARLLMRAIALEAYAVAEAQAIHLPYPDPIQAVEAVAQRTAANQSSMLQDIRRGAPTEIDAICGAIVECGQALGIPTPVNHTLLQLVKALQPHLEA